MSCFYEGILLRGTKIVIPIKLRERVLNAAHEGHPGIVSMKARTRTKVWWPKCDKDAENKVKSCKGCTLVSGPNPPHPLKRQELPEEPWTFSVDWEIHERLRQITADSSQAMNLSPFTRKEI